MCCGVPGYVKLLLAPATRQFFTLYEEQDHPVLALVELCLYSWSCRETGFRHTNSVASVLWTREDHLKVSGICAKKRLLQPMVEHLIAHSAEAAASLLDAVEIGKTLGQNGVTGAWAVLSYP
jgi:hypothetical protein